MGCGRALQSMFPVSGLSCFYGTAFVLALGISLFSVLSLAGINRLQFYDAEENECWAQNSSAFYGEDNILYCPNTFVVSEVVIQDTSARISAYVTKGVPKKSNNTFPTYRSGLYSGDSGDSVDWYFAANPGSELFIAFINVQSDIEISINHKTWETIKAGPDYNVTITFTEFDGYEVKFKSKGATSTDIHMRYTQVYYGEYLKVPEDADRQCRRGIGCNFELTFGKDECINMWYDRPRNWAEDYLGQCVMINTKGYDYLWASIIVPLCVVTVSVILVTIFVVMTYHRRLLKEREEALVMRNVDSDSNLRDGLLEHDAAVMVDEVYAEPYTPQ